jgi:hypothetical protein
MIGTACIHRLCLGGGPPGRLAARRPESHSLNCCESKVLTGPVASRRLTLLFSFPIFWLGLAQSWAQPDGDVLIEGALRATIAAVETNDLRTYTLASNARLRDNRPADKRVTFSETPDHAWIRTGSLLFDGLHALAASEATQNSVSQIKDGAYNKGKPVPLNAFQTGEFWTYVWTRDLSYSSYLALAAFDPDRAASSLLFKTSTLKSSVAGGFTNQIVQDTGSGGSYPVSSDRVVWILGADATLQFLPKPEQKEFLAKIYPILRDTIEQDRRLVFDPHDGLYRGEESFLDWREQTYPGWTKSNVVPIAMSKALSVNAANCFALRAASEYAGRLGLKEEQSRYAAWAKELKTAVNRRFFDPQAGLYSSFILTDSAQGIPVHRYDLLAESLAILLGVADDATARQIMRHYPTGPFGPPVVWPQERTVPIYHNQAIWPFVTAFWIKAARKAGSADAVDEGVRSLMRGAAFNLSNMENLDFVTGEAQVKDGALNGPVINSRRQLWSVAGYLAMVQDVVFGLETSRDGIRFLPFVTGRLRNETFGTSGVLDLRNFVYQGKRIQVRVHLPPAKTQSRGICALGNIELNGKTISRHFVAAASLQNQNQWDIYLQTPPENATSNGLNLITDVSDQRTLFGPAQPQWQSTGAGGISVENGLLALHYQTPDASNVVFNIYRDGQICARGIRQTQWTDRHSGDFGDVVHFYAVEGVDSKTGNASHLTPACFYATTNNQWIIPAAAMRNRGGQLADNRCFMNWGRIGDELRVESFTVPRNGHFAVRAEFANGAGPVNTGITCAVKRLEIRQAASNRVIGAGYLVMPQSGDWRRFDLSSIVSADLQAGEVYSIRIFEDEYSRNMSYLAGNERYTAWPGGGDGAYNFANIASVRFQRVANW